MKKDHSARQQVDHVSVPKLAAPMLQIWLSTVLSHFKSIKYLVLVPLLKPSPPRQQDPDLLDKFLRHSERPCAPSLKSNRERTLCVRSTLTNHATSRFLESSLGSMDILDEFTE